MWQHEIIESLPYTERNLTGINMIRDKGLDDFFTNFSGAPCFFFGNFGKFISILNMIKDTRQIIPKNFPFDKFLFEYTPEVTVDNPDPIKKAQVESLKRAILVINCQHETPYHLHDGTQITLLLYSLYAIGKTNSWCMSPINIAANPSIGLRKYIVGTWLSPIAKEFIQSNSNVQERYIQEIENELTTMFVFLNYLNCRNIYTENVVPDAKLNRKRLRNGKPPMVEYKILKVKKGVPKVKYTDVTHPWGQIPSDCVTAQHLCRGHFKEYTEDAPLFGKYSGRFWWGPQVRGSAENGVIVKGYEVV